MYLSVSFFMNFSISSAFHLKNISFLGHKRSIMLRYTCRLSHIIIAVQLFWESSVKALLFAMISSSLSDFWSGAQSLGKRKRLWPWNRNMHCLSVSCFVCLTIIGCLFALSVDKLLWAAFCWMDPVVHPLINVSCMGWQSKNKKWVCNCKPFFDAS